MFDAVYPLPRYISTRQRLWMLVGKGRFQLTGVLMDVEPVFGGAQ